MLNYRELEYYAVDDRDVIVSGKVAQAAEDFFSAIDGKKFQIPFFSDEEEHEMSDEPGVYSAEKAWQPEDEDELSKNN